MSPLLILLLVLGLLAVLLLVDQRFRHRRARLIGGIGRPFRMNYAPVDRFGLAARLIVRPEWQLRVADLVVKDVLYAAHGEQRCFVATAKFRRSMDDFAIRVVFRLIESVRDGTTVEVESRPSPAPSADAQAYHALLESWTPPPEPPVQNLTPSWIFSPGPPSTPQS